MKKKKLLKILLIIITVPIVAATVLIVYAVVAKGSVLAIPAFFGMMPGNCQNGEECTRYCMIKEHASECSDLMTKYVNFFTKYHLLPADTLKEMRIYAGILRGNWFCNRVENFPDCIDVYTKYPIILDPEEVARKKKLAQALRDGVKLPGGLSSLTDYDLYCEIPAHTEECDEFSEKYILP